MGFSPHAESDPWIRDDRRAEAKACPSKSWKVLRVKISENVWNQVFAKAKIESWRSGEKHLQRFSLSGVPRPPDRKHMCVPVRNMCVDVSTERPCSRERERERES